MKLKAIAVAAALGCAACGWAHTGCEATDGRTWAQLSGNLMEYPYSYTEPPAQTPPPADYVPFHMEHYGRHGSRWLIGANDYLIPVQRLETAERHGKLTPLGRETLDALRTIQKASVKREGELSDRGAAQHRTIGARMARQYPEIFAPGAAVDARSTVVIRCILSMLNGLEGIQAVAPGVTVHSDASAADMRYMNYDDRPAWAVKDSADRRYLDAYKRRHTPKGEYLNRLVDDGKFARDSVEPGLLPYLYWVLANTQSHTGQPWLLDRVFPADEAMEMWRQGNAGWFMHGANSQMTSGRMPYTQRYLLRDMIEATDTAVLSVRPSANLRYGHDGILFNAIVLMELGDYGREVNDLESLEAIGWNDYEMIPKAGNLQLVFYRPEGTADPGQVLVKALLNEREISLPVESATAPYYRWADVRRHWLQRLDAFDRAQESK